MEKKYLWNFFKIRPDILRFHRVTKMKYSNYLDEDIEDENMSHNYDSDEYYDYDAITEDDSDYYSDELY
jgi:hypothetical protein